MREVPVQEYSGLFPSIEDFLWFQLSMVRVARPGEGGGSPGAPSAGFPVEFYTLEALQHYLQQYPPSHYSRNGAHLNPETIPVVRLRRALCTAYVPKPPCSAPLTRCCQEIDARCTEPAGARVV